MAKKKATINIPTQAPQSATPTDVTKALQSREQAVAERESALMIQNALIGNGLSDVVHGTGIPCGPGVQLSQTDTLFKNNRWYLVSNMRQLLSEIYVEHGLIQTIVDVPVDDALRGGFDIKTTQLEPEQIEQLHAHIDEIGVTHSAIGQAAKWTRLYGGGGIIIATGQDWTTPLDITKIGPDDPLDFIAVDMWELFFSSQNASDYDPVTSLPRVVEYYDYYGKKVHHSRVITMKGKTAPSWIRARLRGWGFSIAEAIVRPVNQYLKCNDLAFEVLDEFKLDVFAIKNLTQALATKQGTQKIIERVQLANQQKNYNNALIMDAEDTHTSKQLSFTGLADVMKEIRVEVASALRMPMTKLFGISAAGFNSGEDDIEVYNSMVESDVRAKIKQPTVRVVKILCQKLFGFVPDDLSIAFRPLRILSAMDEETVKTSKFGRCVIAFDKGRMSNEEFADACNRDNLLPVQVEVADELDPMLDQNVGEEDDEGDDGE